MYNPKLRFDGTLIVLFLPLQTIREVVERAE